MPDQLRLSVEPDTDGTCELFAEVSAGRFSGAASAWFGLAELAEFGRSVRDTYPLGANQRLRLEGGFWSKSGAPVVEDLHLGIYVYPIGGTGTVGLRVQLATAVHDSERTDSRCSVQAEIKTNYEQIRIFGQAIVSLAQGSGEPALLVARDT
jgi:hypothetical protein